LGKTMEYSNGEYSKRDYSKRDYSGTPAD